MKENEINNDLGDLVQETIGNISPSSLGTIGLAMKDLDLSVLQSKNKITNGEERREVEKRLKKTLINEMPFPAEEKGKPGQPEGTFYRNAKELYVAGAEGEGCPLEKEKVAREEIVETTFEYFKRHPKGTFFWEYKRPNFNKVIMAYNLCIYRIRSKQHGEKRNILIIAKPDSKKDTEPIWYKGYEEQFSTGSRHLFVSESETVCGLNHVYSPEKCRKQLLYGDDIKGRIEFLTFQEFEESIDEEGKIWSIREEDEGLEWDMLILDNVDISNPALSKIKRRYTLCLLPHVSDFPEALPVEKVPEQKYLEDMPSTPAPSEPAGKSAETEEVKKPMEWIAGYPGIAIDNLGTRIYNKPRKELSQEEVNSITSSLDKLIERMKERQRQEEHERIKPSDNDSLKTRLAWYEDDLRWMERRIEEAQENLPDKSFEIAQIQMEEAQKKVDQIEEEIKKEKELKIRAEHHDMDHIPESRDIRDHLGYWKEDLYLAQNWYQDEEREKQARNNIETLQKSLELMFPKE